jgi:poly(3-hydroxybutyrate) depolymerase
MKRLVAAFLFAVLAVPALAATPVPSGKWSFVFTDRKGQPDRPIRVYTYRPRQCDSTCPIQIVLHGSKRNASDYRDLWESAADHHGFLVVAPEFSQKSWPKAARYNLGDVAEWTNPEKWAYSAIEHLFDEVRDGQADYRLFGHSAGGQFVQRMLLFRPDARASVFVAANPGWYLMPEWRKEKAAGNYPFTLHEAKVGEANVRQALARRMILLVGENDTDPDDENLNQSDGAKKQGESRVDRAENFFKLATSLAGELGVKFAWELVEVPGAAHDAAAMGKAAAEAVYGKPK